MPAPPSRTTGFLTHERYLWHNSGFEAPSSAWVEPRLSSESPQTKRRFSSLIAVSSLAPLLIPLHPRPATHDELCAVHTPRHVAAVTAVSNNGVGGYCGHELHMAAGGVEIAALSAGGVIAAVEAVVRGEVTNAYALVRPPGHHAEPDVGMGFCVFNNVACAAKYALSKLGLKRIAVVDYDVHHGNGTEAVFLTSPDVLVISLHQDGLYPLTTGGVDVVGTGAGAGYNINIPLPPGSGIGAYTDAFTRVVVPALEAYLPELIIVSSGFDASFLDVRAGVGGMTGGGIVALHTTHPPPPFQPLGRMLLTSDDFGALTRILVDTAGRLCNGKLCMAHEGGYSDVYVPFCGARVLEAMAGVKSDVVDPFIADVGSFRWRQLQPHQEAAVTAAAEVLRVALIKEKA